MKRTPRLPVKFVVDQMTTHREKKTWPKLQHHSPSPFILPSDLNLWSLEDVPAFGNTRVSKRPKGSKPHPVRKSHVSMSTLLGMVFHSRKMSSEGGGRERGRNSRVVPKLDLAPVAQLAEPPELVVRVLRLSVAEEVHRRIGKGFVWVVEVRVEVTRALGEDVAGRRADVAVFARDRGVLPLLLCPTWLVDLGVFLLA